MLPKLLSLTPPSIWFGQRHKVPSLLHSFWPLSLPFTNISPSEKANPQAFQQYSIISLYYTNTKDSGSFLCFRSEHVSIATAVRRSQRS